MYRPARLPDPPPGSLDDLDARFKFTTIAHTERLFLGPYGRETIERLLGGFEGSVVDVGCGKGAVLEALGQPGFGIEHNPAFAAEARLRNPQAEIWEADAKDVLDSLTLKPDLIVCLGASQAVGTPAEALARFAELVRPGGSVLFGDGYWRAKPAAEYLEFLGASESDIGDEAMVPNLASQFGLTVESRCLSTDEDWDAYECAYAYGMRAWCEANPDDPDCAAFRGRIDAWSEAYRRWGRSTLGFGIWLLRRPS